MPSVGVESPLLNVRQAARYLNMTERWVKRSVSEKRFPYMKLGGLLMFRKEDLDAYLDEHMVYPPAQVDAGRRKRGRPVKKVKR